MKRIMTKNLLIYIVFALTILILPACGVEETTGPSSTTYFTADAPGSGATLVSLQNKSASGATVYLDVQATGVSNLYGADINITYDASKVNWAGTYQAGTLLESGLAGGTDSVQYLVSLDGGTEGTVVIGATLMGDTVTPVSGDGTIISIPFTVVSAGESSITFTASNLYDDTPVELMVNAWNGGRLTRI